MQELSGPPVSPRILLDLRGRLRQLSRPFCGVLAQLVERLNGIEEVRGSNPLGSTTLASHRLGNQIVGLGTNHLHIDKGSGFGGAS